MEKTITPLAERVRKLLIFHPTYLYWLNGTAFRLIHALIYPVMIWGLLVALSALSRQPGVVCNTPLAWPLAFWSGVHYARRCDGRPGRFPLLGPAMLGAALGLAMG